MHRRHFTPPHPAHPNADEIRKNQETWRACGEGKILDVGVGSWFLISWENGVRESQHKKDLEVCEGKAAANASSGEHPRVTPPVTSGPIVLSEDWQRLWAYLQRTIWQSLHEGNRLPDDEPIDTLLMADLLVQSYFSALQKEIPEKVESNWIQVHFGQAEEERLLLEHVSRLNTVLCEMARKGKTHACEALWTQALKLTEAFGEIALENPQPFKQKARRALFMPSLRTSNLEFMADAAAIAEAIELSKDSHGDKLSRNRVRIGELTSRALAEYLEEIQIARRQWCRFFTKYKNPVIWPTKEDIAPFLGKSVDDLLGIYAGMSDEERAAVSASRRNDPPLVKHIRFFCLCAGCGSRRLHLLLLPPRRDASAEKEWLNKGLFPLIEEKFETFKTHPAWREVLKDSAKRNTDRAWIAKIKDKFRELIHQFRETEGDL